MLRLRLAEARSPPQHHRVVSQALLNSLLLTHPECFCTLNLLAVPPMCQAHSCLRVFAQPKKKKIFVEQSLALSLCGFLHTSFTRRAEPPIAQAGTPSLTLPLAVPLRHAGSVCWALPGTSVSHCQRTNSNLLHFVATEDGSQCGVQAAIALHPSIESLPICELVSAAPGYYLR